MDKKAKILYLILSIILFLFQCGQKSDRDPSLTVAEYRELGLPELSRVWTINDFNTVCKKLGDMKVWYPKTLPKKTSKKSSSYFERIIDLENISFVLDDTLPLRERAYQIQEFMKIQAALLTIYTDFDASKQFYDEELMELYIFGITITQNMLDLGELINESTEDENIEMQSAFTSIRHMYIRNMILVLDNQRRTYFFKEDDMERLSEYVSGSLKANSHWMEPAAIDDIKEKIKSVIEKTRSSKTGAIYTQLISSF